MPHPLTGEVMETDKAGEVIDFFDVPLEHFPDRSIRWLLQNKANVQSLIELLAKDITEHIAFDQLVLVNPSFLPDTLREQTSDLVFQVPLKESTDADDLLIYILIEHQSTVDELMGFVCCSTCC